MRIVSILAVLAILAYFTHSKTLGAVILLFIVGCALFGLSDFVFDLASKADIRRR